MASNPAPKRVLRLKYGIEVCFESQYPSLFGAALGQPDGDAWESLAIQQMWNEETHVAWEWPRHKRVVGSRTLEEKVFLAGPFATRSSWPYY